MVDTRGMCENAVLRLGAGPETAPSWVEMTDGTFEFNANFRERVGQFPKSDPPDRPRVASGADSYRLFTQLTVSS